MAVIVLEIGNAAMTLLRASDTLPDIKATALQVAAILGQPEAPVVARQWLAAPGTERSRPLPLLASGVCPATWPF